jgi:hypothetical protein
MLLLMSSYTFDIVDLTSDTPVSYSPIDPVNDSNSIPDTSADFFNLNSFEDFDHYNPSKLSAESVASGSHPLFNYINIPDIVSTCSSINDFLWCITYIPARYSITQFFIDYIYFLENLCSLDFNNSILFRTFVEFQLSKDSYYLNQINYILNTQNNIFNTSFNEFSDSVDLSNFDFSEELYNSL